MQKHIFDNNGIQVIDGIQYHLIKSLIYWENDDPEMDAKYKSFDLYGNLTENHLIAELVAGGIEGICPIEIREERISPDGSSEITQRFYLDPVAAHSLYLFFKRIDDNNKFES